MNSYVKLHKSLASKSKNKKSSGSKVPPSSRPVTPVASVASFFLADVDDRISIQFASFSESFDRKL